MTSKSQPASSPGRRAHVAVESASSDARPRCIAELVAKGSPDTEVRQAIVDEASRVADGPSFLVRMGVDQRVSLASASPFDAPGHAESPTGWAAVEPAVSAVLRTLSSRPRADFKTGILTSSGGSNPHALDVVPLSINERFWGALVLPGRDQWSETAKPRESLAPLASWASAVLTNQEGRNRIIGFGREQAALRRVAELVAGNANLQDVVDAVAAESSGVLEGQHVEVLRHDEPDEVVAQAIHGRLIPRGSSATPREGKSGLDVVVHTRSDDLPDPDTAQSSALGPSDQLLKQVSVSIAVDGQEWGTLSAAGLSDRSADDALASLTQFGQLISTSLASSRARAAVRDLVEEQTALRRIADLAARDAPMEEVLHAMAREAVRLARADFGMVLRFVDDRGSSEVVATAGITDSVKIGLEIDESDLSPATQVLRTRRIIDIRHNDFPTLAWPHLSPDHGFIRSAGIPLELEDAVWGVLVVATLDGSLTQAAEEHLAQFADLASSSVAAAGARHEVRMLASEQAALRRVAELVARGASLDDVFAASAQEASALLGQCGATLMRFEGTDAVVVAASDSPNVLGSRLPLADEDLLQDLVRRGLPPAPRASAGGSGLDSATYSATDPLSSAAVAVVVEGQVWGALTSLSRASAASARQRLASFAELVAAAIANAQNKAKLTASRARVVASADAARHRLQRDVHDGAQQRLVHAIIALRLARDASKAGGPSSDLIEEALTNAERASQDLRDIVQGVLPAALARGGLPVALDSLVRDLPVPTGLEVDTPRLPVPLETTAYFVVAEATTNITKHAGATAAHVRVALVADQLELEVIDNGRGGADAGGGTGLTGLSDRVEASRGTLSIKSPRGGGTVVRALIPLPPVTSPSAAKAVP